MIDLRLIRVFDGPRHDLLRNIWDVIAEYAAADLQLTWFPNPGGMDHATCLNRIWEEAQQHPSDRLVITEHDFLPDLNYPDWLLQDDLEEPDVAVAAACYAKRAPGTRNLTNYNEIVGPWFMSFAKSKCPGQLEFRGPIDPAGTIQEQLKAVGMASMLYPGADPYPLHCGVEYIFGTHLFWSRHYNDDSAVRVSGFSVGEITSKHDRCVHSWIVQQPAEFQQLLAKRLGSAILESSFEYIDARSTYDGSPAKLDNYSNPASTASRCTSVPIAPHQP